jgi:hypothetical protein
MIFGVNAADLAIVWILGWVAASAIAMAWNRSHG